MPDLPAAVAAVEPVYAPALTVAAGLLRAAGSRLAVSGAEHLPAQGGAVLAANHVSYLDPVMLALACRRTRGRYVRFLAKRELFAPWPLRWPLRQMRHIPVDREGDAGRSLDEAVSALVAGELVGVFPEGTISPLPSRQGRTGAARMALATGVPLVPVAVWGGQEVLPGGRPRLRRRPALLTVAFARPVRLDSSEDAAVVTRRLMASLAALVERARLGAPPRHAPNAARARPGDAGRGRERPCE